jgi:riboflavin kinase
LPADNFSDVVSEHTSGVYFGWAGLSTRGIYKMVMSIGWNPYFDNTEKTVVSFLFMQLFLCPVLLLLLLILFVTGALVA